MYENYTILKRNLSKKSILTSQKTAETSCCLANALTDQWSSKKNENKGGKSKKNETGDKKILSNTNISIFFP